MLKGSKLFLVGLLIASGCDNESSDTVPRNSVAPACVEDEPADDAWTCDEVRTLSCEDANADPIEIEVGVEASCDDVDLLPVDGPFTPGETVIEIEDAVSGEVVCTATLEVTDDEAPVVESAELDLWPPNHKMHEVSLEDCIESIDECDPEWDARITSVSSDEPANDTGDGNTESDVVVVSDDVVSVRAERAGGGNGRVYTIAFEVEDSSGNVAESSCTVSVVHDQSGDPAIDDGAAYTVSWP